MIRDCIEQIYSFRQILETLSLTQYSYRQLHQSQQIQLSKKKLPLDQLLKRPPLIQKATPNQLENQAQALPVEKDLVF